MEKLMRQWKENYFEIFFKTRLLTQIVSFLIAVMMFLSLGDSIYFVTKEAWTIPQNEVSTDALKSFFAEFLIGAFIGILFFTRFLLLFSKRKISFWLSQVIWIALFFTLLSRAFSHENYGCAKNVFGFMGESLSYILVSYMFLSPIRQFLTLLASVFEFFPSK